MALTTRKIHSPPYAIEPIALRGVRPTISKVDHVGQTRTAEVECFLQ